MTQKKIIMDWDIHVRLPRTAYRMLRTQARSSYISPSTYARLLLLKALTKEEAEIKL